MKALVKYELAPDRVEIREVPDPTPGPGEVIVEVRAAGICGSDIEMYRNVQSWHVNVPVVGGHEFAGVIAELGEGEGEGGWSVGDRVVSETAARICGRCAFCRSGDYNLCPDRLGFGYGVDGAFARYVRVPERCLHRVPAGLDFAEAAIVEPLCVAYNAVAVKSRITPGEPAAVIGPGPVGLFAVQVAGVCGASPVAAIGAPGDEARLAAAGTVGADVTFGADAGDRVEWAGRLTDDWGFPLVVDCAGNSEALRLAIALVRRNGQITKVGWGPKPVGFSLDPLVQKAAALQGSFSHTWRTWEACLRLLASGRVTAAPLVSARLPLDEWRRGYELMESRQAIKVVLEPG
jgi:alcohol dehydrogenase/L-iditol 2-dehydrogenase